MSPFRPRSLLVVWLLASAFSHAAAADAPEGWTPLFNGKDLSGWTPRNPKAKKVWVVCDDVKLDPSDPARLLPVGKGGRPDAVLLCGDDGRGSDLMTEASFGDYELHLEFTVPKGSNSGVYNRGLFEIQIFDSFGVPKPAFHDCGALYERAVPPENLSKPPGQWQTYDITMKGKRITLVWNGRVVYRDQDVRYGETDRAAFERLTKENATKPPELRVKLEEKDGKYVGFFGEGAPAPAWTAPTGPARSCSRGTTGRWPSATCASGGSTELAFCRFPEDCPHKSWRLNNLIRPSFYKLLPAQVSDRFELAEKGQEKS